MTGALHVIQWIWGPQNHPSKSLLWMRQLKKCACLVLLWFFFLKVDRIVKVQFISFFRRSFYTNQNKSKILQCSQFLWLQIKILRCASLGLIRSSVKWSCDFLGGINPPICYTQLNCCVGRVILCKMPYGRQMLWKMCFACIWSRSKPVNPAITTLQSLYCVHYVPSPITQTLNWTGCSWSCTYILGLVFCEEVMLGLLSCVNL